MVLGKNSDMVGVHGRDAANIKNIVVALLGGGDVRHAAGALCGEEGGGREGGREGGRGLGLGLGLRPRGSEDAAVGPEASRGERAGRRGCKGPHLPRPGGGRERGKKAAAGTSAATAAAAADRGGQKEGRCGPLPQPTRPWPRPRPRGSHERAAAGGGGGPLPLALALALVVLPLAPSPCIVRHGGK